VSLSINAVKIGTISSERSINFRGDAVIFAERLWFVYQHETRASEASDGIHSLAIRAVISRFFGGAGRRMSEPCGTESKGAVAKSSAA
jgi:hypothetical protein